MPRPAGGRSVIDFGSRRAHGPQAGLLAARAAYIGGCTGTSNVEAARLLGIDYKTYRTKLKMLRDREGTTVNGQN